MAPTLASSLTLSATAYVCKAFMGLTTKSYEVHGLPTLMEALRMPDKRDKGKRKAVSVDDTETPIRRGIVTVCNHNSVVDDPGMWSLLPSSTYFPLAGPSHTSRNNRWTLGASDVMFINPILSKFFSLGQVIETYRGGGIFQPAVDEAVKKLQEGNWIHIFPEGKINQEISNPEGGLLRFKWGVGRIIMDSKVMPEIIPMWISGFDQIMNETRTFPRPIPRPGARISITIGQPLTSTIEPLVKQWKELAAKQPGEVGLGGEWGRTASDGSRGINADHERMVRGKGELEGGKEQDFRIKIVERLQEGVKTLGQEVEKKEGRFEKGLWSHSTSWTERGGNPGKREV